MSKEKLIQNIRELIADLKEEEMVANNHDNPLQANGLCYARVNLERVLTEHGYQRPTIIDND